eukprot:Hpha_TRINITY_DN4476_c1_g1::TRINITY_DN4476_c1_g1_i1::g.50322::m.50322
MLARRIVPKGRGWFSFARLHYAEVKTVVEGNFRKRAKMNPGSKMPRNLRFLVMRVLSKMWVRQKLEERKREIEGMKRASYLFRKVHYAGAAECFKDGALLPEKSLSACNRALALGWTRLPEEQKQWYKVRCVQTRKSDLQHQDPDAEPYAPPSVGKVLKEEWAPVDEVLKEEWAVKAAASFHEFTRAKLSEEARRIRSQELSNNVGLVVEALRLFDLWSSLTNSEKETYYIPPAKEIVPPVVPESLPEESRPVRIKIRRMKPSPLIRMYYTTDEPLSLVYTSMHYAEATASVMLRNPRVTADQMPLLVTEVLSNAWKELTAEQKLKYGMQDNILQRAKPKEHLEFLREIYEETVERVWSENPSMRAVALIPLVSYALVVRLAERTAKGGRSGKLFILFVKAHHAETAASINKQHPGVPELEAIDLVLLALRNKWACLTRQQERAYGTEPAAEDCDAPIPLWPPDMKVRMESFFEFVTSFALKERVPVGRPKA